MYQSDVIKYFQSNMKIGGGGGGVCVCVCVCVWGGGGGGGGDIGM